MDFLKGIHGDNLQDPAETLLDSVNFLQTSDHQVGADRDPDLGFYRVFRAPVECLDPKILLDPFEEQFDAPACLVNARNGKGWSSEVVGEKDEILAGFGIAEMDSAQFSCVFGFGDKSAEPDRLIADQTGIFFDRTRFADMKAEISFCTDHEESTLGCKALQAVVIEVATVHDIDATRLDHDLIKEVDIVNVSFANPYKYRDRAGDGHLRVDLDSGLRRPEVGPWEPLKAQVDGCRINGVDHFLEVELVVVRRIQSLSLTYQNLRYFREDLPAAVFIGVGNIGPGYVASDAHGITLTVAIQARFNVAQTLPESELGEDHTQELIAGAETTTWSGHRVFGKASAELFRVQNISDLGEDQSSMIHPLLRICLNKGWQFFSNRGQGFSVITSCFSDSCINRMAA